MRKQISELENAKWPEDDLEHVANCPVCKGSSRKVLYAELTDRVFHCAPGMWSLYLCSNCGVAYLDPRPTTDSIFRAYEIYYTHAAQNEEPSLGFLRRIKRSVRNGYLNRRYGYNLNPSVAIGKRMIELLPFFRAKLDRFARHLGSPPHIGARLLDVGCASGAFLNTARNAGWEVVGVDSDARAVAIAQGLGINAICGTVNECRFPDEFFDAITLNHVIEHVHEPLSLIQECRRILVPGGILWLSTPNLSSLGHKKFGPDWMHLDPPRHLVLFTPESLRNVLMEAKFSVEGPMWPGFHVLRQFSRSNDLAKGFTPLLHRKCRKLINFNAVFSELKAWIWPAFSEEIVFVARKLQ